MDLATGLVSLVSALGVYVQEGRHREGEQKEDLRGWLLRKNYKKVLDAIAENTELSDEINHILRMNHDDLVLQLNTIERCVASIASNLDGFSTLPELVAPDLVLSTQAIDILKVTEETSAQSLIEDRVLRGPSNFQQFVLSGGTTDNFTAADRFIDTDLDALVELSYLSIRGNNSDGKPIYTLTRSGSELAKKYLNK